MQAIAPRTLVTPEMETGDLRPLEAWGHDAQWADELHHHLHVLLTGEREGYYGAYGSLEGLAAELRRTPAERLIVCSQNHDQVGNRALGDRPAPDELELRAALLLFAPQTPLLFQGEEYGERRPFRYFTDHVDPAIAEATREGRKREFALRRARSPTRRPRRRSSSRSSTAPAPTTSCARSTASCSRCAASCRGRSTCASRAPVLRARRGSVELVADFEARRVELTAMRVWPGEPFPLGAIWDGEGTNFSLFSEHAERVELCLFDARRRDADRARASARRSTGTATCPASARARATATASTARTRPEQGHRFNPAKLLIDPYAKAIEGPVEYGRANVLPYVPDGERRRPAAATTRTTRPRSRSRSWSTRASTGRATSGRERRGTRRSSTRRT